MNTGHPVFQKFVSTVDKPLASLQCQHVCAETGIPYLLWSDIRNAFKGIVRLETTDAQTVPFTIGKDGDLYVHLLEDKLT